MRFSKFSIHLTLLVLITCLSSCGPVHTVLIRVDDLRSDFVALESSLDSREWPGATKLDSRRADPAPAVAEHFSAREHHLLLASAALASRGR